MRHRHGAKAAGNGYSPAPVVTAPVVDSTQSIDAGRGDAGRVAAKSLTCMLQCAVKRRVLSVGEIPTRQLSLQPVAIGAAVEVTKQSKPLV